MSCKSHCEISFPHKFQTVQRRINKARGKPFKKGIPSKILVLIVMPTFLNYSVLLGKKVLEDLSVVKI
jgi:hypothetical protein